MCKNISQNHSKISQQSLPRVQPFLCFKNSKCFVKHLVRNIKKTIRDFDLTEDDISLPFEEAKDHKMVDENNSEFF